MVHRHTLYQSTVLFYLAAQSFYGIISTLYISTLLHGQISTPSTSQRIRKKELVENALGIIQLFVRTGAGGNVCTGCQFAAEPRNSVRSSVRICPAPPIHSTCDGDTAVKQTISASGSPSTYRLYHQVGSVVATFVEASSKNMKSISLSESTFSENDIAI